MATATQASARQFLYEHAFLPPNPPQCDHDESGADFMLKEILIAAQEFSRLLPASGPESGVWQQLLPSLSKWVEIYASGTPCLGEVTKSLQNMSNGDVLLFYLKPQNAALLVRTQAAGAIFECFEVLPTTDAVMAAKDALTRHFPARAIFLPTEVLDDEDFKHNLGTAIYKLSVEQLRLAMETTKKGPNVVAEIRQSPHPRLVTEWLFGVLSTRGNATSSPTIQKRTHDDVCWKSTDRPWRRSGVYLSARVALQIALHNVGLVDNGYAMYKNYMLYFLSRFARVVSPSAGPDARHILRVKIARRNAKLGTNTFPLVQGAVQSTLQRLTRLMETQWEIVTTRENVAVPTVPVKSVSDALNLEHSRGHLQHVWERAQKDYPNPSNPFKPSAHSRTDLPKMDLPTCIIFARSTDLLCSLVDLEHWVADNLSTWMNLDQSSPSSCAALADLIKSYHRHGVSKYNGYPERMSIMFLVIFELWMALDSKVTALQPLMLEYPPELDCDILGPLLLHTKAELERLARVESYISYRRTRCDATYPSVFSDPSRWCLAVNYYETSQPLADLRATIETAAGHTRKQKRQEWETKKAQFERLMAEVANSVCDKHIIQQGRNAGLAVHHNQCVRCAQEKSAHQIKIEKHEWPLPVDEIQTKAVIFELNAPEELVRWRDITWYLLQDVSGRVSAAGDKPMQQLLNYSPLSRYALFRYRRVTLASSLKPMHQAHQFKAGLDIDAIFVENGMYMQMNDSDKSAVWMAAQTKKPSLRQLCSSSLPTPLGSELDRYVNDTDHTENSVVAKHPSCPIEMGSHEYMLYGSLRSGERLQLMNLVNTISSTEIDLNSSCTALLFLHAVSQVGTPGSVMPQYLRESQLDFTNVSFCRALLTTLYYRFSTIEANWKEATAATVILELTLKMLSLVPGVEIQCATLVHRIRQASLGWIRQLAALHTQQRSAMDCVVPLSDISRQIVKCCVLMRRTYDVDHYLESSISLASVPVEDYVEASVHLHDHLEQRIKSEDDAKLRLDLLNDAYQARYLNKALLQDIEKYGQAISGGIERFWPSASFDNDWNLVYEDGTSWLENECRSKVVHFNLLTGKLLVAGRPLSRLPTQYRESALYQSILGDLDLEVFAADVDDMEYMSRELCEGYRVYLGWRDGVVIVQAHAGDHKYEALLSSVFLQGLPRAIVKDSVPWMSLGDGTIEFRDRLHPWTSLKTNWVLHSNVHKRDGTTRTTMRTDQSFLIDYESVVGRAICRIFRPFEQKKHIVISMFQETSIQIWLPRFHLNFFVQLNGEVKCKELSAVIDSSQAIDTFHGLQSRLVLRAVGKVPGSSIRTVLVPIGDLVISKARPHVRIDVHVDDDDDFLSFSQFRIDNRLGQLLSPDLESHIYKTYLHAITSLPERDELTGRTGTEESLSSLSDVINRTSVPLSDRARKLLHLIAGLSPKRTWYPSHLKVMQTHTFHDILSTLSQRDVFFGHVLQIFHHNLKASFLFEDDKAEVPHYSATEGDLALLDRSHHHTRKLYPVDSVGSGSFERNDRLYNSRDRDVTLNEKASFTMAELVQAWPAAFTVKNLKPVIRQWKDVSGFQEDFPLVSFSRLLTDGMQKQFPQLFKLCRTHSVSKQQLVFVFSLLTFGNPEDDSELRILLALAVSSSLRRLPPPEHNSYDLKDGSKVDKESISEIMEQCEKEFTAVIDPDTPESEREEAIISQRQRFERDLTVEQHRITSAINASWPNSSVTLPRYQSIKCFDFEDMERFLNARFEIWHKNHVFLSQVDAFDRELNNFSGVWRGRTPLGTVLDLRDSATPSKYHTHLSLLELMRTVNADVGDLNGSEPTCLDGDLSKSISGKADEQRHDVNSVQHASDEWEEMLEDLDPNKDPVVQDYAQTLLGSIAALKSKVAEVKTKFKIPPEGILESKATEVKNRISFLLAACRKSLQPCTDADRGLVLARLWPEVNVMSLLRLLSAQHRHGVPSTWLGVLLLFAREITALQRVERIQKYRTIEDGFALQRELGNLAHAAWRVEEHPDWLLLEIQNNLLIRPVQIRVANELMKQQNGLVLLGMGEGKTSVILPMVVTALSNGTRLVRVVVLKPLANEMLRQLSNSLAGLCGRTVYYLPFSRSTPLDSRTPDQLMELYKECRDERGVLLSLPEHQNSFRLVGADRLTDGDRGLAYDLLRVQKWLDRNTRDVLDESDELLKPGYELVYTNGEAKLLSGAPDRWTITLELLALASEVAVGLHRKFPTGIEFESRSGIAFPHIRVISDAGANELMDSLTREVLKGRLSGLPLGYCDAEMLNAIRTFLQDMDMDNATHEKIVQHFQGLAQLDILYVVRGLISHQIMTHALRKRWRVNYGLDRSRCLSAVPYRAKSIPSPNAEFAQPEMMVTLTALSWLYTGLKRSDLRKCFIILLKSPDPSHEYSNWVRNSNLPEKYRSSSCINLDDASFLDELYGHLKDNSAVINFYLRYVVYPREAKEFLHKLSSSAWDLCANDGGKVTSGFSGTCDSRVPKTCFQKDLEDLRHSTALTMTTLLRQDNRKYVCAASSSGQRLSTTELLRLIVNQHPSPSVIIDVGAQILESNKVVVTKWLDMCKEKLAAIFFNDNDEKMVLNRDGTVEPFVSSIFKDEIRGCLIYLDEFHTRGTDFQFPDRFEAGVLLGPGLLKDTLAQACMRMRKLAVSQSVRFFAPPEVDNSIRALLADPSVTIDSSHVLRWVINGSCQALKSQTLIWTLKGLSHSRRRIATANHVSDEGIVVNRDKYLSTIRERESRPVSEMYWAGDKSERSLPFEPEVHEKQDKIMHELLEEWERTDVTDLNVCGIGEEQEREVLHEIEHEREVQRPRRVKPANPCVWEPLEALIKDGVKPETSAGLGRAFNVLSKTKLASQYVYTDWPSHIFATVGYLRTIVSSSATSQDDFLRPVQWVLKAKKIEKPIIISAYEANLFLPAIRKSEHVTLILYQARTGKSMPPFDSLTVYRVPETKGDLDISLQTIAVLNLFAGQLYFSTFEHYQQFCLVVGLWDGEWSLPNKRQVAHDNYVSPACREANGWTGCTFKGSPVKMLKEFIGMRRLGIQWSHTHMGRVLSGRLLRREDFEDVLVDGMARLDMQSHKDGEEKSGNWCEVA
ncbi:hypothetical protein LTR10_019226 [Elasticomyces elasticus]|uniref:ubiquitinyl hydrolase 1 n=1 Tax=Exophiala sideris TaxID=1016849 RepID=A0ABR0JQJ4_9EURO|nr:hypothetical protein LTR10_019226 [Elasticomyces elasticus]KAK5038093.1 hypothetical protein LTS07_001561 [Exophiala sideris]KAK5044076.1 hypothetical protein LTR13_000432 [Exophiala sideris]KAK5067576.1 hypothetical protein LTR69_001565 [Exophiala sideris]KAK5184185.1 hypothetical protein LTR44_003691 [Eurotiomycetes sp. CCFEE 6388]